VRGTLWCFGTAVFILPASVLSEMFAEMFTSGPG
jgi:hypothetical protein